MKEWYAASIIMLVKFKDGNQDKFPVMENVVLIKASSGDEATEKAEEKGREIERDSHGTFTWNNRPAEWVFAGIRKVLTAANTTPVRNRLSNGTEVTFSEFELESEEAFKKLINGEDVMVHYEED
jgi:hypothetical protein